jgi:hypothetical protein
MDQAVIDAWLDLLGSGVNQVLIAEPDLPESQNATAIPSSSCINA